MLKILKNIESTIRLGKGRVGISGNCRENYGKSAKLDNRNEISGSKVDGVKVEDDKGVKVKNHQKMFKSQKRLIPKNGRILGLFYSQN